MTAIVAGVADGCERAGAALLGGETAEMPDFYSPGEFDMAGSPSASWSDGESSQQNDPPRRRGDRLGQQRHPFHGYSLVRKLVFDIAS